MEHCQTKSPSDELVEAIDSLECAEDYQLDQDEVKDLDHRSAYDQFSQGEAGASDSQFTDDDSVRSEVQSSENRTDDGESESDVDATESDCDSTDEETDQEDGVACGESIYASSTDATNSWHNSPYFDESVVYTRLVDSSSDDSLNEHDGHDEGDFSTLPHTLSLTDLF